MKILLYRGKSFVSKAIQLQTRSPYSHVAIQLDEHEIYEAWHVGGVRRLRYATEGHDSGTVIDICRINNVSDGSVDKVRAFLQSQIGKKYDFKSVLRFITRRKVRADNRWFCSELVLAALEAGGIKLLNINYSEASPRDVSISPNLTYENTSGT